jgi:hypothetical protein
MESSKIITVILSVIISLFIGAVFKPIISTLVYNAIASTGKTSIWNPYAGSTIFLFELMLFWLSFSGIIESFNKLTKLINGL